MKKICVILSCLILANSLWGAFTDSGWGVRPMGMGGAFTAIAEGPEATYYNPAGLGFHLKFGASLSYKSMSLDRHMNHVAVSMPIRNEVAMAASWVNAGVSDVSARGQSRQLEGTISNSQNAFTLSFAKALDSTIAFGGTLRYLQEKLDILDAFTVGVDLGFLVHLRQLIFIGGTVQNLGSTMRWDSAKYWNDGTAYDENLPVVAKFGVAGNLFSGKFIPAVDFEKSNKMNLRFRTGAEYWFVKKVMRRVEDEYEEGKFTDVPEYVRFAGLRVGLDRGSLTFGASYAYHIKDTSIALEYAYLTGQQGTSTGHLFTLKLGL